MLKNKRRLGISMSGKMHEAIQLGYLILVPIFFLAVGYHEAAISFCVGAIIGILLGRKKFETA